MEIAESFHQGLQSKAFCVAKFPVLKLVLKQVRWQVPQGRITVKVSDPASVTGEPQRCLIETLLPAI